MQKEVILKVLISDVRVKELLANEAIQEKLKELVKVPNIVTIKKVNNPFTDKETYKTTQKIHAVAGTSIADMIDVDFTLIGQELDGNNAINKEFEIFDYNLALEANMKNGNFVGYSATGLKLLVNSIREVKKASKGGTE